MFFAYKTIPDTVEIRCTLFFSCYFLDLHWLFICCSTLLRKNQNICLSALLWIKGTGQSWSGSNGWA